VASHPKEGAAIRLRPFELLDLPTYRHWLEPHHEWHQWDGPYYPLPTAAESDETVRMLSERISRGFDPCAELPPTRLVVARTSDDQLIGTVNWYWESQETNWARMGISLFDPAVRGQGIGTQALELWTGYLFACTDWARLDFATWSGNLGMMQVGRKLGFTQEGRFRKARIVRGEYFDSVVYGVLREEWEERGA
jgi:RimJ/RimL family protein N-acetyltransferase